MAAWNSRGLRGSSLEEYINMTNEKYLLNHLGLIQKIPTPITPRLIRRQDRLHLRTLNRRVLLII